MPGPMCHQPAAVRDQLRRYPPPEFSSDKSVINGRPALATVQNLLFLVIAVLIPETDLITVPITADAETFIIQSTDAYAGRRNPFTGFSPG